MSRVTPLTANDNLDLWSCVECGVSQPEDLTDPGTGVCACCICCACVTGCRCDVDPQLIPTVMRVRDAIQDAWELAEELRLADLWRSNNRDLYRAATARVVEVI